MSQAAQVSLCVEVARAQASSQRGHSVRWTVTAWATGGNVPDATIQLRATPATGGAPRFSLGCGHDDGTSLCHLGTVRANSAQRQLQARLTVPVTASAVKSVSLTAVASAAHLAKTPEASATVSITALPSPAKSPAPDTPSAPPVSEVLTSPLPVGALPTIPAVSPTLSPSGNAADLFPTLAPKPSPSQPARRAHNHPMANISPLSESSPIADGQLAGLAALALGLVLAITRLAVRRRSAPTQPIAGTPIATEPPAQQSGEQEGATPAQGEATTDEE